MDRSSHGVKALFKNERFSAWVQIVLGCAVGAASYPLLMTPCSIAPGGLTGVGMIFNYLFRWPVGTVSLALNVPLFLIGYKTMGKGFVLRTLVATLLFSLLIDLFPLPALTDNPLLASVFGGLLLGVGLGLILRGGATTGGTDMMARMVHKRVSFISVGMILLLFDACVILAAAFTMGAETAMYSLICVFVSSKTIDLVMTGTSTAQACYVITDRREGISARVMHELERGVTFLKGTGAYTGREHDILLTVIASREVPRLKRIVREEDPHAFMFFTDSHETLGEGFTPMGE